MSTDAPGQPSYMIVNPGKFSTGARPDGTFGPMWTVTIEHPDGEQSSFVIPDEQYNAQAVADAAASQAGRRAEVARLGYTQAAS